MTRYHARWVLPVTAPPLRDGTVVVESGRVSWVGLRSEAPLVPGTDDVELGDAILLPGLVNAHIHLDLAAFSGALNGESFFAWVRAIVDASVEVMDERARADAALFSVVNQLEHGVTTMADTSPSPAGFDAMVACGARGIAYLEAFGPDPAQCDGAVRDVRNRTEAARREETSLVRVGVSPHAPYSVSDALYRAVADYARDESLPVAVHIAESADESLLVAEGRGEFAEYLRGRRIPVGSRASSPIALLDRTRVLTTRPVCIHAVRAGADDVLRLADNGAGVAHCPLSNRWFSHGDAPVDAFRAHRIPVGVGTDSAASNDLLHVLGEAGEAAGESLDARDRIALATVEGARAIGLDDGTGTLAPGAPADLAAFAIRDLGEADRDPARYLLAHCVAAPAMLTVVGGVVRARNGRAAAHDEALDERVHTLAARIRAWATAAGWRGASPPS